MSCSSLARANAGLPPPQLHPTLSYYFSNLYSLHCFAAPVLNMLLLSFAPQSLGNPGGNGLSCLILLFSRLPSPWLSYFIVFCAHINRWKAELFGPSWQF